MMQHNALAVWHANLTTPRLTLALQVEEAKRVGRTLGHTLGPECLIVSGRLLSVNRQTPQIVWDNCCSFKVAGPHYYAVRLSLVTQMS